MSRLIVCLLIGVCVATVFAADSAAVAPVDSPVSSGKPKPPIVDNYDRFSLEEDLKPASGSEHNDKEQEHPILIGGSNSDKSGQYHPLVPADILPNDKVGAMPADIHLTPGDNIHAPLMTGDLLPEHVVSNASSGASVNHSIDELPMEATTKKTFIMKIPTKSPMLDAMMNTTMDNKTMMMTDNKTMIDSDKMMQDAPEVMTTMKPGMTTMKDSMTKVTTMSNNPANKSTSSQLVGNNATAPTSIKTPGSSATIVSPTFIVAILAMLGSRLC